ncbi:MAG: serine/threonine protein kinase [Deltaproteobacteria bacterium]
MAEPDRRAVGAPSSSPPLSGGAQPPGISLIDVMPPDPLLGTVLDRYRVLEKIGEGGMGTVYAVEHVMLQKRMALKLLRSDLCRNQELVIRFQNEAVAASRIGQENIVNVTDFGRTPDGLVYFVMEELQGLSIGQMLRAEQSFSIERSLALAAQACRALHAAHAAGIIHRDLKPENIVVIAREGVSEFVKVLDFGISKMGETGTNLGTSGGQRLTQLGMIVGTPEYMSPEQAAGKPIDHRADIYSLGVVLFEMLTGRLPFVAENSLQMLMKHQTEAPPRLATAKPDLQPPELLEATVQKLLAKEPERRQQSMAELLGEIQACAEILGFTPPALWLPPSGVTPPALRSSLPPINPTSLAKTLTPSELARIVRPSRAPWLIALAALGLIAGAALFAFRERTSPPELPTASYVPRAAPSLPPTPPTAEPASVKITPVATPPTAMVPPPIPKASPRPASSSSSRPLPAHAARPPKLAKPTVAAPPESDPYQKVDDLKAAY